MGQAPFSHAFRLAGTLVPRSRSQELVLTMDLRVAGDETFARDRTGGFRIDDHGVAADGYSCRGFFLGVVSRLWRPPRRALVRAGAVRLCARATAIRAASFCDVGAGLLRPH